MVNESFKLIKRVCVFLCLAVCFGCDSNSDNEEQIEQTEQRPNQPTEAIEANLNWKLAKLVEVGDEIKIPEELLKSEKVYVIQFKDDGTFDGHTAANEINGSYAFNKETGKIELKVEMLTQVADILYGDFEEMYLDYLFKKVYSYSQSDDGLYLYFGKDSYLKYQAK